ncbi:MAG: hypothetical protein KGJ64_04325 [Betaproteobacteria bacterium]|nr:hypothetical protein [Betaproteobacteria bacterium]
MSREDYELVAFWLVMFSLLMAGILYVVFGQVTVRRLRRNPATRDCLGVEFLHGGDIGNVAQALGWPRWLQERSERGSLGFMMARSQVIREHTTALDRALGRACFWAVMLAGSFTMIFCFVILGH